MLKKTAITLCSILITFLIAGLALGLSQSPTFRIEISKPFTQQPSSLFAPLRDLTRWDAWLQLNQIDPNVTFGYGTNTVGLNSSFSWKSLDLGHGEVSVINYRENERIQFELHWESMSLLNYSINGQGEWILDLGSDNQESLIYFSLEGTLPTLWDRALFKALGCYQAIKNHLLLSLARVYKIALTP